MALKILFTKKKIKKNRINNWNNDYTKFNITIFQNDTRLRRLNNHARFVWHTPECFYWLEKGWIRNSQLSILFWLETYRTYYEKNIILLCHTLQLKQKQSNAILIQLLLLLGILNRFNGFEIIHQDDDPITNTSFSKSKIYV